MNLTIMKRKIHILTISMIALLSVSCSFLEVEKIGKSDIQTYFSEISAFEPAMNGIYNLMYSFYDRYYIPYVEVAGNDIVLSASAGGVWVDYQNFATTSDNETSALGYIWKGGYEIINNANQVIYWAPLFPVTNPKDSETIANVLGAAYYVRALLHFDLCRVYGQDYGYTADASHLGIAIRNRIPSLSETIARSSVHDCYQQAISDLQSALASFSNCTYNAYRPTPLACKALLAKIYLYMGDMEQAEKYASEVIAEKPLTKREDYVRMYCDPEFIGDESIFRINGYEMTTTLKTMFDYQSPVLTPADGFLSRFDKDDIRNTLFSYSYAGKEYPKTMLKYTCTKEVAAETDRYCNIFMSRVSEMYLIRAEANCSLGNTSEAEKDIKTLISRATGKQSSEISLNWKSAEELDALIYNERKKELCFEGHCLFDITRRHEDLVRDNSTTSTVRKLNYPDNRFVLQIPYVEMDANDAMEQNPL